MSRYPRTPARSAACKPGSDGRHRSPLVGAPSVYQRSAPASIPIYIDTPRGRLCAGHIVDADGRKILRKTGVREETHLCRKHHAWGIELQAYEAAVNQGVEFVRIVLDGRPPRAEEAPMALFTSHGIRDDLGWGRQIFLKRRYFRRLDSPQLDLFSGGEVDG